MNQIRAAEAFNSRIGNIAPRNETDRVPKVRDASAINRDAQEALKAYQAEQQKALDQARGVSKDTGSKDPPSKDIGKRADSGREKDRSLELSKSVGPKGPRDGPDDGYGRSRPKSAQR